PPPPRPPSILGRLTMGLGLLSLGILAVIDNVTTLVDPQPRHYLALATVIVGAGLLTGSFIGRARWMILLGVFLLPPLVVSPAAEVNWNRDLERTIHPASLQVLEPSYEAPAGRYVFDLTDVNWNGQTADLAVNMAAGEIIVVVPDGVGLSGTARVNVGEVRAPDGTRSGIGDITRTLDIPGEDGNLNLNLDLGFGSIQIETNTPEGAQLGNSSGFGDFSLVPVDASQLEDVEKTAGNISIDLRSLTLDGDAGYRVSVGAGDIDVIVPADLRVVVNAHTGAGTVSMFGRTSSGLGADGQYTSPSEAGPTLVLELHTGAGDITVKKGAS
ncbi:MAG: LiaF domain-containing protein, partial [Acidimicrobiia bacterium]